MHFQGVKKERLINAFIMSAFLSDYTDKWECGANLNRFCYSHKFNWLKREGKEDNVGRGRGFGGKSNRVNGGRVGPVRPVGRVGHIRRLSNKGLENKAMVERYLAGLSVINRD